jgi:hypothetical protein
VSTVELIDVDVTRMPASGLSQFPRLLLADRCADDRVNQLGEVTRMGSWIVPSMV